MCTSFMYFNGFFLSFDQACTTEVGEEIFCRNVENTLKDQNLSGGGSPM